MSNYLKVHIYMVSIALGSITTGLGLLAVVVSYILVLYNVSASLAGKFLCAVLRSLYKSKLAMVGPH